MRHCTDHVLQKRLQSVFTRGASQVEWVAKECRHESIHELRLTHSAMRAITLLHLHGSSQVLDPQI
jgi:hypothetical protein